MINPDFWKNKRVFITGNTGFKGSWLSLFLLNLGAEIKGYSLDYNDDGGLYKLHNLSGEFHTTLGDIRDYSAFEKSLIAFEPDIILHLAAQAQVREGYSDPVTTFSTNVMGTVNVLQAARRLANTGCILNVTTDKCYRDMDWSWGYRETDALGGIDPYSNSKACSELVTESFSASFFNDEVATALATARSGNVIGGGDWSCNRLIPDFYRAVIAKDALHIRNPNSIRPWQFVLDPIVGYLTLVEKLFQNKNKFSGSWNFGPEDTASKTVDWIINRCNLVSRYKIAYDIVGNDDLKETQTLRLDISKSKHYLSWQPQFSIEDSIDYTINWYDSYVSGSSTKFLTEKLISDVLSRRC